MTCTSVILNTFVQNLKVFIIYVYLKYIYTAFNLLHNIVHSSGTKIFVILNIVILVFLKLNAVFWVTVDPNTYLSHQSST